MFAFDERLNTSEPRPPKAFHFPQALFQMVSDSSPRAIEKLPSVVQHAICGLDSAWKVCFFFAIKTKRVKGLHNETHITNHRMGVILSDSFRNKLRSKINQRKLKEKENEN